MYVVLGKKLLETVYMSLWDTDADEQKLCSKNGANMTEEAQAGSGETQLVIKDVRQIRY